MLSHLPNHRAHRSFSCQSDAHMGRWLLPPLVDGWSTRYKEPVLTPVYSLPTPPEAPLPPPLPSRASRSTRCCRWASGDRRQRFVVSMTGVPKERQLAVPQSFARENAKLTCSRLNSTPREGNTVRLFAQINTQCILVRCPLYQ